MPTALITGITGQDGSYLAELLLKKGREQNLLSFSKVLFSDINEDIEMP